MLTVSKKKWLEMLSRLKKGNLTEINLKSKKLKGDEREEKITVSNADIVRLLKTNLPKNNNVLRLNLSGLGLFDQELSEVFILCQSLPKLKYLDLSHNNLTLSSADKLEEFFNNHAQLDEINVKTNQLTDAVQNALVKKEHLLLHKMSTLLYEAGRHAWDSEICQNLRNEIAQMNNRFRDATPQDLLEYLQKKQYVNNHYYGEDLSDDSDEDGTYQERQSDIKLNKKIRMRAQERAFKNATTKTGFNNIVEANKHKSLDGQISFTHIKPIQRQVQGDRNPVLAQEIKLANKHEKIEAELAKINQAILDGTYETLMKSGEIKTNYVISQYRGINYFVTRWNAPSRRLHRTVDETNLPLFSEAVLKTLEHQYDIYTHFPELWRNYPVIRERLEKSSELLKQQLIGLRSSDLFVVDKGGYQYIYDNLLEYNQDRFSNGIYNSQAEIKTWRENSKQWQEILPNNYNFRVACSDLPYHSLRYLYALKSYYNAEYLTPSWDGDGRAERPHVGKIYASMHPLDDFKSSAAPLHVGQLNQSRRIVLKLSICPERETSHLAAIPKDRIVHNDALRFPSFAGPYKTHYLEKYGMDEQMYDGFQTLLKNTKPHTLERKCFQALLAEWLCAYQEVMLLQRMQKTAISRNAVMLYLTNEGTLSLTPPLSFSSPETAEARSSMNELREMREQTARILSKLNKNMQYQQVSEEDIVKKISAPATPEKDKKVLKQFHEQYLTNKSTWSPGLFGSPIKSSNPPSPVPVEKVAKEELVKLRVPGK